MDKNSTKRYGLNFSEKQLSKPQPHSRLLDNQTGKPIMMCKLYIPGKDYRPKDVDLGIDSNGIDRNERKGYINIPEKYTYKDMKKPGRMFAYFDDDRVIRIHFNGEKTGKMINFKPEYDKVEPLDISAKDFIHLYDGAEKNKEINTSKEKTTEPKKQINRKDTSQEL